MKAGLASKEAAFLLGVSDGTLRSHRHRGVGLEYFVERGRIYYAEQRVRLEQLRLEQLRARQQETTE